MEIITSIPELKNTLSAKRNQGFSVGLVPTMGALHKGHLSLLDMCLDSDHISVVSIYVNPTQFNNKEDLKNYPRNTDKDIRLLKKTGCHIVFIPGDKEMYPSEDTRKFDFGMMGKIMEGKFRPGHFEGVAKIVTKLFDIVEPDRAYFGKKDFQQLAIIKRLAADYQYNISIVGCPIVRETDGLAMSSRNQLLSPQHRQAAPVIYKTLRSAAEMIHNKDIAYICKYVTETINAESLLQVEYFEVVDSLTLEKIDVLTTDQKATGCIAVFAGKVRLIDNIDFIL